VGEAVWKILGTGAAIGAGILAKKLATTAWKLGTGNEPPVNPEDPEVTWKEAVGWAVASGAVVGVARLIATRKAAAYYRKSTGHEPKGLNKVS
jgi:hypothetical protein